MSWTKWIGAGVLMLAVVYAGVVAYGNARWTAITNGLLQQLEAGRRAPRRAQFGAADLNGLPAPVQRYFKSVLPDGAPIVTAVTVEHVGTIDMGKETEQWKAFTSTQRVVTNAPGFLWNARMTILPGLDVRVHDAYVNGEGILHPAVLGLFAMGEIRGSGDIAHGELLRFFAEAAWYPTALLPGQGVTWDAIDDSSARATLVDRGSTVTMTFRFGADGLMTSVRAEERGRAVGGRVVPTAWEGRWSNYQLRDGMRVPMTGEVAWMLPEGRKPYWRGTITSLEYERAR